MDAGGFVVALASLVGTIAGILGKMASDRMQASKELRLKASSDELELDKHDEQTRRNLFAEHRRLLEAKNQEIERQARYAHDAYTRAAALEAEIVRLRSELDRERGIVAVMRAEADNRRNRIVELESSMRTSDLPRPPKAKR